MVVDVVCRYNEHFEGSVLAHSDTKIQGHTATILEGLTPYFCMRLTTTLLLFTPKVGLFVGTTYQDFQKLVHVLFFV